RFDLTHVQLDTFVRVAFACCVDCRFHQGFSGGSGWLQSCEVFFCIGDVDDVRREAFEPPGGRPQHLPCGVVEGTDSVVHGLEVGVDGGQRGAQLVTQICEHPPPGDVCCIETSGQFVDAGRQIVELPAKFRARHPGLVVPTRYVCR